MAGGNRWVQLVLGIVCMMMIANLQYGWTLFVLPIQQAHPWPKDAIQVAFTLFIITETWLIPIEGMLIDRLGPAPMIAAGGVLIALGWTVNSQAEALSVLYLGAALGGVGAGIVYGAAVGNALRWFADRRGLAAGLTAAGFGAGSALTIVPISGWIATHGYQSAFLTFGLAQGAVVLAAACFIRAPALTAPIQAITSETDAAPRQVLKTPLFWLLYAMFVMVGAGGLMATAQLAVVAADYGVAKTPVSIAGLTMAALPFALAIDRVLNGITRPFFGWVSDIIGREPTMFIAFALEGIGIVALVQYANDPVLFVVLSGLVFFAWGEIYSLFPAICGDAFGRRHATTNYGMLYTAKGTAALIVPYGNTLREATGSWAAVFYAAAVMNIVAALLALFVLRPMRQRHAARRAQPAPLAAMEPSAGG